MFQIPNDAVIVTLPFCKPCNRVVAANPGIRHISLDAKAESQEVLEAKKAIAKLRVAGYPVVLNTSMTKVIGYPAPMPKEGRCVK